ncbi:MAG: hypothetical protein MT490_18655 [Sphingomonas sp.]|uniref:hypothetical protein n=1 Tax=Sphingomonas sp. TaxID=28214 RepID=UPI00227342C4|nr:hypothetical protein [Sphingomonas sp.]MCX8477812.1 hypothetical protein [Sphingomonas sp.]
MTQWQNEPRNEYSLFGLNLRSEIPLPELQPLPHEDIDAISITIGRVAPLEGVSETSHTLMSTAEGAIIAVAGVGRFCIRAGCEIVVDADPSTSDRNVRLFLLGSAMGALLHQRAMLPLHANVVDVGGRAVGFLGASGAGKSTLAAAFHDRSYQILSDDICVVTRGDNGHLAEPGIPRLRLWRDAVERSGRCPSSYERAFDELDKYTVGIARESRASAIPLQALYLLMREEGATDFAIRQLAGVEALKALMVNTYRGIFLQTIGDPRKHFQACLRLNEEVPLFALSRPWDTARIDETITRVEGHLDMFTKTNR